MELANRSSIYKRDEPLVSHCTSSNVARGHKFPDPKIAPHTLYKVRPGTPPAPLTPHFPGFSPLSKKFLKNFSPRAPGTIRRALNRLAAPSSHPKTSEFRGKTAHARLASSPKSPAKHRPGTPKTPSLMPHHIKKLSKVRSTLLTPLPGECILEYMRLKAAAQTTSNGAARAAPTASKTFKLSRLALEEAGH